MAGFIFLIEELNHMMKKKMSMLNKHPNNYHLQNDVIDRIFKIVT